MPEVLIVDYGAGNLLSLKVALEKTGLTATVTPPTKAFRRADAIALPGVGNFSAAAKALGPICQELISTVKDGTPILGICLGLQLYFQESEEGPGAGLGFFEGRNVRLTGPVKIPHMGWNTLHIVKPSELFDGISEGAYVYFVHSLYPVPTDKTIVCTETEYSETFASSVTQKNIFGLQFHPEKSGETGARILQNFARLVSR